MRLLNADTILITVFLFVLMILIPAVNIRLLTKRKHSAILYFLQVASAFAEVFLFCLFMCNAIIDMAFERYYFTAGIVCLSLSLITVIAGVVVYTATNRSILFDLRLSPDLASVFSVIEDAIIIADINGDIINTNKPSEPICKSRTLSQLLLNLKEKTSSEDFIKIENAVNNAKKISKAEVSIDNCSFHMVVSPILIDEHEVIGVNILFHNIQERVSLAKQIENQNVQLQLANKQLIENIKIDNALKEEKERLNILQSIQISLFDNIQSIINYISEFNSSQKESGILDYHSCIAEVTENLRKAFLVVRASVHNLAKNNKKL